MSAKIIFYMLTASLLVNGCSHSRPQPVITGELFTTNITVRGLKLFFYRLEVKLPGGSSAQSGGKPSSGGPRGKGSPSMQGGDRTGAEQEGDGDWVNLMLTNKLAESGYCRNGYIELERNPINNGSIRIRGECEEVATPADRQAFPNS